MSRAGGIAIAEIEPTKEQKEQLSSLVDMMRELYPELKDFEIGLEYGVPSSSTALANIQITRTLSDIDILESMKQAKKIWKKRGISGIKIVFSPEFLLLEGGVRKDSIFYVASHELTHLLRESWQTRFEHAKEDDHSEDFNRIHLQRVNDWRARHGSKKLDDLRDFAEIMSIALVQAKIKKTEGKRDGS